MSVTKNECNQGSPSIYRPEANAWISKRSSDLDYKGVFALIKIGFLQSSFYEVMWSSLFETFPGRFGPGSFRPWAVSANFGGSFRPDFSPSRLGMKGRTIILLAWWSV